MKLRLSTIRNYFSDSTFFMSIYFSFYGYIIT